jgi:hypothetical protein
MGIGDLGGPSGGQPSAFTSTSLRGTIDVGAVAAYNGSLTTPYSMSFQLNAFLAFDWDNARYAYWVQDVALVNTQTRSLEFEDNVWNATTVQITNSSISGNGTVSGSGDTSYYGFGASCALPGACGILPDPQTITLELNASLNASGVPTVQVLYGNTLAPRPYDTLTFPFATSVANFRGFDVDPGLGVPGQCPRCFGDVELIAGGPGNGYQTALDGTTDLVFSLSWWNGNNYEPVPNAANHGEATEEGISEAVVSESSSASGEPEATVGEGTSQPLGTLWTQTGLSTVEVSIVTGYSGGTFSDGGPAISFQGKFFETILVPGSYPLAVTSDSTPYPLGTHDVSPGEVLTLEAGALATVFVPTGLPDGTVWSVTFDGQLLYGTGNITFGEVAGLYPYVIGSVSGYRAAPSSGNVTVAGSGAVVPVQFTSTQTSLWSQLLGDLRTYETWVILGVVVLVIIVVASVARSHRRPPAGN